MNQIIAALDICLQPHPGCLTAVFNPTKKAEQSIALASYQTPQQYKKLKSFANFVAYLIEHASKDPGAQLQRIVTNGWCDAIIGIEDSEKKPTMSHTHVIFNHIIARECAKKNITVLLKIENVLDSTKGARIIQILQMCNKYKTPVRFISLQKQPSGKTDMQSLMRVLIKE